MQQKMLILKLVAKAVESLKNKYGKSREDSIKDYANALANELIISNLSGQKFSCQELVDICRYLTAEVNDEVKARAEQYQIEFLNAHNALNPFYNEDN